MPDTCTIRHVATTSNSHGGFAETFTDTEDVPCRLSGATGSENTVVGATLSSQQWTLTLPYDTTIAVKDRVLVLGRTMEVVNVDAPRSWITARRITLQDIQ